jgi:hypothetical protein
MDMGNTTYLLPWDVTRSGDSFQGAECGELLVKRDSGRRGDLPEWAGPGALPKWGTQPFLRRQEKFLLSMRILDRISKLPMASSPEARSRLISRAPS